MLLPPPSLRAQDFLRIAGYYEQHNEAEKAGDMWERAEQPPKAVDAYLRVRAQRVSFQSSFQNMLR